MRITERACGRPALRAAWIAVSAENVAFLLTNKLVPLGIVSVDGMPGPKLKRFDPMLALKFKTAVVPEGAVRVVSSIFRPLFWPPVVVAVLLSLVALDAWVFFSHGIAQSFRELLLHPSTMLIVMALMVFYIVNVFKNERVDKDQKVLWAVVLFMGNMIAMPVYW